MLRLHEKLWKNNMYIVEGNIGAGKSTFLQLLKEHLARVTVVTEPVASWDSNKHGTSVLQNFIEDSHRWSYTMETFTMMCRVKEHMHDQSRQESQVVVERSIYSGHYVFSLNGYQQGFMTELEWKMYCSFFNYLIPGHCKPPKGFIYLRTNPVVAFDRIKKRSRSSEVAITLDYLKQVHDRHEDFLVQKNRVHNDIQKVPVLVLDCNKEFEADPVYAAHLIKQVQAFIQS
jgi:deoxyadenosine/deoxycytidine kinase